MRSYSTSCIQNASPTAATGGICGTFSVKKRGKEREPSLPPVTEKTGLLHGADQFLNGGDRLVHHGLLFGIQFELEDLLDAGGTQDAGDAHVEALDAELAVQVGA